MNAVLVSAVAGLGVHLMVTSWLIRSPDASGVPRVRIDRLRTLVRTKSRQHGLDRLRARDLGLFLAALFLVGVAVARTIFGGWIAPAVMGLVADAVLVGALDRRRRSRNEIANEAWPRLVEEIRMLAGSLGRPLPKALFDAARAAPDEMQPAFDAARREWSLSTDFTRAIAVLKDHLADANADAVCETLLIAHELGGSDVDRRLADLAADRREDLRHRRDARARQAGVRFARRFVLIVPLGMALVGQSLGDGRAAYATPTGQLVAVGAIAMVLACWLWAGALMRLPTAARVLDA